MCTIDFCLIFGTAYIRGFLIISNLTFWSLKTCSKHIAINTLYHIYMYINQDYHRLVLQSETLTFSSFDLVPKGASTLDTLECTSESGFRTSFKWSVLMCIDALWHVHIIQFAYSLAAGHSEQHSVVVLHRKGKVQSCEGFEKKWFDRQHTNMSWFYREGFGEGQRRHAVPKRSG